MVIENIPLNYYKNVERKLIKDYRKDINFSVEQINRIRKRKGIRLIAMQYDEGNINELIKFRLKYGLSLYDSLIFKTFVDNNLDYFVTKDNDFLDNKALKRDFKNKIKSPEETLKLI